MSEETALARNFAEFTDEQIAAYPQTARSHIVGLAGLCDFKSAELSALRERVKVQNELLDMVFDDLCTTPNCALRKSTALELLERYRGLSTRREEG